MRTFTLIAVLAFFFLCRLLAEEASSPRAEDVSTGLPAQYADFFIASSTLSRDGKFAVIYPKADLCDDPKPGPGNRCQNYLVALQPFQVLTTLATEWPEFEHKSHGGLSALWSKDGTAVLVTLDSKWGPGDIFLYELHEGQLTRSTNLLKKVRDLLQPDFKKSRAAPYNEYSSFVFDTGDEPICEFIAAAQVRIRAHATTEPKGIPGIKAWEGKVEATWNILQAKFTEQRVKREFAGVRKGG